MYCDDPEENRIGRGNFYSQYDRRTIHHRTAYRIPASPCAQPIMSALGQKRTFREFWHVRFTPEERTFVSCKRHVRFVPRAD